MLAAYATLHCWTLPILFVADPEHIVIEGQLTPRDFFLLALLGLAPVAMAVVGWLVSRMADRRRRATASTVSTALVGIVIALQNGPQHLGNAAGTAAVLMLLTGLGVGSVAGWSARMTLSHLTTIGGLAVRALPVVLLTTLVFFNGNVWLMSATITGGRLALAVVFLVGISAAFVVSATAERIRPMLRSPTGVTDEAERLADTPFAAMPDPPNAPALSRIERVNVVFVLVASQLTQITVVAALTSGIYVVLGLIVLTPALLKEWARTTEANSTILNLTVPVPDSLTHLCLFLGALTFMYVSARAAGDDDYRATFVDPLIADLRAALVARGRYRGPVATTPMIDAGELGD